MKYKVLGVAVTLVGILSAQQAMAAIALDRTRVVFNGTGSSVSLNIKNNNTQLPYLAQSWIEDDQGNKITSPLTALPPVQRVEPGTSSQVKVQGVQSAIADLPQDRESLFYFNLREIPPKSDKPNTLQIALQTRVKLFYRPPGLEVDTNDAPWQENMTLSQQGNSYLANNPTPYYITLVDASSTVGGATATDFSPLMVPPHGSVALPGGDALGSNPVVTYVNDYGGRTQLKFNCSDSNCTATVVNQAR